MRIASAVHRSGHVPADASDQITLDYEARFLRRKKLVTDGGEDVLVDLPETTSLNHGDALEAEGGWLVVVSAAPEPLIKVTGDLTRLAWHIGNRHTPCQIAGDHLLIRHDPVLENMLHQLGATTEAITGTFTPEGGAYGHGRTHDHSH